MSALPTGNDAITFNVVFTPGTPARLLPFALSLLQGKGVRIRLVANGCGPDEIDLLRAAAQAHERISPHVLPSSHPVEHGLALNRLFEAFPSEPYFAFADSDVIASGDFMGGLWPMAPGQAAVSAAAPVWATDADAVVPPRWPVLSGRLRVLPDGTPAGTTYLAIYERAATEPLWRRAPKGFGVHHRHRIPRGLREQLAARGWNYRILDTCRLVNLQLLLAGFTLEDREIPELHHVGGFSGADFMGLRALLRSLPWALRSKDDRRLGRIVDYVGFRLYLHRRQRDPRFRRMNERRSAVGAHVLSVLDAILAGKPPPPTPRTDSAEVDRRLAALIAALETHYRPL